MTRRVPKKTFTFEMYLLELQLTTLDELEDIKNGAVDEEDEKNRVWIYFEEHQDEYNGAAEQYLMS